MADAAQVRRTSLPLILAMATGAWTLGVMVAGQAGYPGYDQAGQFISELGAVGAPTHPWAGLAGFIPLGVLQCLFCLMAAWAAPKSGTAALGFILLAGYGVGAIAGGIFPCDAGSNCMPAEPSLSQILHNALGGGGYLAGIAGLAVLGAAALRWPDARWLAFGGFAASGVAFVALMAIEIHFEWRGALQRVLELAFILWFVACGLWLANRPAT